MIDDMYDRLKFDLSVRKNKQAKTYYCHLLWKVILPDIENDATNVCRHVCPHAYASKPWECYQFKGCLLK